MVTPVSEAVTEAATATPVFALHDVTYRYGLGQTALDGVTLAVPTGRRIAVLGANGSGKSTLLRLLDGLYFPERGSVAAFGEPLTEERLADERFAQDFRRRVALVFQNPDVQLFNPTVFDEIAFGPLQLRWPKDEIRRQVRAMLDLLEIAHLRDRAPHQLSGGEKKRVALASVLVLDPEVLLLDEPTAALDPRSQSQVVDLLIGWGDGAKTTITATHDLDIVTSIADWCLVFGEGRLVAAGKPSAVLGDGELLWRTGLVHAYRPVPLDGRPHPR